MSPLETLSSPLKLACGLELPNRLVKAPMAENMAKPSERNLPGDAHVSVYRKWAEGQFGMLITGNVEVDPRFLGAAGDVAVHRGDLDDADVLRRWKAWAEASQATGPACVQLNHPGRQSLAQAGTRWFWEKNIAPSAVPLEFSGFLEKMIGALLFGTPREMSLDDIDTVVEQFTTAAKLAFVSGFKAVQVHAAHGYLLTQFLSPRINKRTDNYGGSPEKRLKLLLRIIQSIRAATSPDFCIGVKLNSADFQVMGLDDDEVLQQVKAISEASVDFIEISGGTYEKPLMTTAREGPAPIRESTRRREAYFAEFSHKAREIVGGKAAIMLSGGFRSRVGMAAAVSEGSCDLIGVARPACLEPDLPMAKILSTKVLDEDAEVDSFILKGGNLLKKIPILGVRTESFWHEAQIKRMGAGKTPDLDLRPRFMDMYVLERLLKSYN